MAEERGRHAGEEGDVFGTWPTQPDGEEPTGGRRASTVPPSWAPKVVAPPAAPPTSAPPATPPTPAPPPSAPRVEPLVTAPPAAPPMPAPLVAPLVTAPPVEPPPVDRLALEEPTLEQSRVDEPVHDIAPDPAMTRVLEVIDEPLDEPDLSLPPEPTPAAAKRSAPVPVRHTFAPRTRARRAVAAGTLLAAGAAVLGCYVAARERDLPSIGIAVTLWVLTGIIWAVHSGTSVTRLTVRGGQLQVTRQGVRTTIDLTSSYTPVEVYGRPGRHGWKVVFRRRDMSPFVIDQSMVDPAEFMSVLQYYRPNLNVEKR
ncbi:hypothetical protein [Nocardioides sp. AN3]